MMMTLDNLKIELSAFKCPACGMVGHQISTGVYACDNDSCIVKKYYSRDVDVRKAKASLDKPVCPECGTPMLYVNGRAVCGSLKCRVIE